jgi:hypothetical protein
LEVKGLLDLGVRGYEEMEKDKGGEKKRDANI